MRDRLFAGLAIAVLTAYGGWLYGRSARGVGGSDSVGYVATARSLVSGRIVEPVTGLDELGLPDRLAPALTPLAFVPGPRPRSMAPSYPPGFSLHIAVATALVGKGRAPYLVNPVVASLCLALVFLLGRELGLSRGSAAAGAAILAASPIYLWAGGQPMSDLVATFWAVAAILAALRARRQQGWSVGAGAALGMAVLVRPTNLLLLLPLGFVGWRRRRSFALAVAGGLPFAIFLVAWNHAAYGGFLRTGYSGVVGADLAVANFPARFPYYLSWLVAQLSPLIPLGWLGLVVAGGRPLRDRLALLAWFASLLTFYCFWESYEAWWYTRFLLPAIPALIVGAALVARDLSNRLVAGRPRLGFLRGPAAIALVALVARAEWQSGRELRPISFFQWGQKFADGSRTLGRALRGQRALVVSREFSAAVHTFNGLPILRWDRMSPDDVAIVAERARAHGYAVMAALLSEEVEPARRRVPGTWEVLARIPDGATLWRIDPRTRADCPSGAPPLPETCNGADDDCNGAIDDLPQASYSADASTEAAFKAKNAACTPTDDGTWLACANAIHLMCREAGCRTSGIGPLEWAAGGAASIACVTAPPPVDVTPDDLARFGTCPLGRPLAAPDHLSCAQAIHGYCRSLGRASGFGPVASPRPSAWSVVCLDPTAARTFTTTYDTLAQLHSGCAGPGAARDTPAFCASAARRFCVSSGYLAGFGPVAGGAGPSPTVVCLDY